jgi:ariadne-1
VLSNSYAFAYFFFGGQLYADEFSEDQNTTNQNLFEDGQEQLAQEVRGLGWRAQAPCCCDCGGSRQAAMGACAAQF